MSDQPGPSRSLPTRDHSHNSPRVLSPDSTNLRHRGPARSATFAEGTTSNLQTQRRNSTFSDSVSEARHSIRSSTDDILFPRVAKGGDVDLTNEESHWHSAPLGLALLPAIAGIFFQNGSAVVTDITLLVLAAIFLNWSVRLPWDWYRSAQAVRQSGKQFETTEFPLSPEPNDKPTGADLDDNAQSPRVHEQPHSSNAAAATRELQIHELAALASCFIFPLIGTWLLHTIRSKLSRPSEGLVSNYNLTIFLLASEIRPFSHLLKMVQARTLHLQRIVALSTEDEIDKVDAHRVLDLTKRLEELEAHIAEAAAARLAPGSSNQAGQPSQNDAIQTLVSQATADMRKSIQWDIDALNRAVRRYEKRTTLSTYQTETRFQALEARVHDTFSLAAAAHRTKPQGLINMIMGWTYTVITLPGQIFRRAINLPMQVIRGCLRYGGEKVLTRPAASAPPNKGKSPKDRKSQPSKGTRRAAPPSHPVDTRTLDPIKEFK
ncbi:uncharacterized protein BP01DRAFT_326936 [Aspergillus saccharolyticus JOP 1030-1]|uniref:Uncharacterized protein n=1 Tax=Aspergillus saccharolyticus JOP 1030-1 TaxID=1450539 RepID=A0A318Z3U3_9EURO|nr:hypothetical protein BP01DRAFT_326936 [Aspergillus saccharolyticus JOP 1030-1]PYH41736.1 hypothetical protein BP01DRAFT_326936 [Aspergillus saccharolyticus JOP 1030-1]